MVEGGRWDEVVEFLDTLTEVKFIEDRQAGNQTIRLHDHSIIVVHYICFFTPNFIDSNVRVTRHVGTYLYQSIVSHL